MLFAALSSKDPFPILRFFLMYYFICYWCFCCSIKTHLDNSLSKIFLKGKPAFSNDPKSLLRNLPDGTILDSWVFDNFILAGEFIYKSFTKPWSLSIS